MSPPIEDGAPVSMRDLDAADKVATPAENHSKADCHVCGNAPQDVLSQLRRRHQAALRLPPLRCGSRDPEVTRWWR